MDNKTIGNWGEGVACDYLKNLGYEILERNWRTGRAEIDIIAKHDDILVFVEVKTRSYEYYGSPESSISEHKQMLMADSVSAYMDLINHDWEIRFDFISIIRNKNMLPEIKHFEDAFFPKNF